MGDSPADDFGATTVNREAITFDDPPAVGAAAPPSPEPPSPEPHAPARADGEPLWAGTLAPAPVVPVAMPVPAPPPVEPPAPVAAPAEPPDPDDFTKTTLHKKAFQPPAEVAAPIDHLGDRERTRQENAADHPVEYALWIGLALVVFLILGSVVALAVGLTASMSDAETVETAEE